MAGHSHFKNIKRKKEAADKKRGTVFSKLSRLIIAAVKEGGKDPQSNSSLRLIMEKAREEDMPKENIERAIKRGSGEGEEGKLENFLLEVYGPEGITIIVEGSTDNKNRNLGEIKEILKKHNYKLADPGSVKYLFEQKGVIEVDDIDDDTSLEIIEAGAEDIEKEGDSYIIYTNPNNIEHLKSLLNKENMKSSSLGWKPKLKIPVSEEKYKNLIEDFENYEAIENIYINV